jgi:hypothetical protein
VEVILSRCELDVAQVGSQQWQLHSKVSARFIPAEEPQYSE